MHAEPIYNMHTEHVPVGCGQDWANLVAFTKWPCGHCSVDGRWTDHIAWHTTCRGSLGQPVKIEYFRRPHSPS